MKPAFLVLAAFLTSCGYISAPMPPALGIPTRVTDLQAIESGENIEVQFTLMKLTTDGLDVTSMKSVELRASVNGEAPSTYEVPVTAPGPASHHVPARDWIGKDVVLTVRAAGPKGKTSEWSNQVTLHVEAPLVRPANFKVENVDRGVRLSWTGSSPQYRIFRATGDQKPERLAESDSPEHVDDTTHYGMIYQYSVRAIVGQSQQSDLSDALSITPKDEFAPAIPAAVTAVPDVSSIELAWTRNTESDFQGYNVYRSLDGASAVKIASLIQAPTYSDHQIEAGKKYSYTVTAVDVSGNESRPSAPQEVTAQ